MVAANRQNTTLANSLYDPLRFWSPAYKVARAKDVFYPVNGVQSFNCSLESGIVTMYVR